MFHLIQILQARQKDGLEVDVERASSGVEGKKGELGWPFPLGIYFQSCLQTMLDIVGSLCHFVPIKRNTMTALLNRMGMVVGKMI